MSTAKNNFSPSSLGILGIIIALLAVIVQVMTPELRFFLGLTETTETPKDKTEAEPTQPPEKKSLATSLTPPPTPSKEKKTAAANRANAYTGKLVPVTVSGDADYIVFMTESGLGYSLRKKKNLIPEGDYKIHASFPQQYVLHAGKILVTGNNTNVYCSSTTEKCRPD